VQILSSAPCFQAPLFHMIPLGGTPTHPCYWTHWKTRVLGSKCGGKEMGEADAVKCKQALHFRICLEA
jgi:hypothetical protein